MSRMLRSWPLSLWRSQRRWLSSCKTEDTTLSLFSKTIQPFNDRQWMVEVKIPCEQSVAGMIASRFLMSEASLAKAIEIIQEKENSGEPIRLRRMHAEHEEEGPADKIVVYQEGRINIHGLFKIFSECGLNLQSDELDDVMNSPELREWSEANPQISEPAGTDVCG